jgi:hypothetical protein
MALTYNQLTKDISTVDIADMLSGWRWRLTGMKALVTISVLGDAFLLGDDNAVYWLETGTGNFTKIADSLEHYKQLLNDEEITGYWFLPSLVEELLAAGKILKDTQVYSYKQPPLIGGDYSVDNFEPCDPSVHFSFTGQLYQQVKDLPEGTPINNIKFMNN